MKTVNLSVDFVDPEKKLKSDLQKNWNNAKYLLSLQRHLLQ